MSSYPKVAVITPVYNGEAFLREAMNAVQGQTYPNLVHLVLDNASTDATPKIIEEFAGRSVPVIHRRNDELLPIGENWNKAVSIGIGEGDYFRVLCADDTIQPDSIQKMVALAEQDPDIAIVGSSRETQDGVEDFGWDRLRNVFGGKEAIRECFLNGKGLAPPHVLYRSAAAVGRSPFFDDEILSFDTDAVFYLLDQPNAKFGFIHEPLCYTRRHGASITSSGVKKTHSDYFDWLFLACRYGKRALNNEEMQAFKVEYRRHYLRRLIIWRFVQGNKKAFEWHLTKLKEIQQRPTVSNFADAFADYALQKMGYRQRWTRYPQG